MALIRNKKRNYRKFRKFLEFFVVTSNYKQNLILSVDLSFLFYFFVVERSFNYFITQRVTCSVFGVRKGLAPPFPILVNVFFLICLLFFTNLKLTLKKLSCICSGTLIICVKFYHSAQFFHIWN